MTILLFAMLGLACSRTPAPGPGDQSDSGEGRIYIQSLAAAVRTSDRIVLTEHSNGDDVLDLEKQPQRPAGYVPRIYATQELSADQRAKFLALISSMSAQTQDAEPACIFEPHHTIKFYRSGKLMSAMRICFQCGQVEWDGTTATRPWSLVPALESLVSNVGMRTKADWHALAAQMNRVP